MFRFYDDIAKISEIFTVLICSELSFVLNSIIGRTSTGWLNGDITQRHKTCFLFPAIQKLLRRVIIFRNCLKKPLTIFDNTPVSNYASVPANNNLKSRLVLSCAIHLLYFLAQLSTSLDFKLLFAGTDV